MDEIQQYLTVDDPIWEIEDSIHQCHFEAINELIERDDEIASQFDPLPNYPQIQVLRQVDDCDLTFEINDSALSFQLTDLTLQVFLYNKNDWKDKTIACVYQLTKAFDTNIWAPITPHSKANEPCSKQCKLSLAEPLETSLETNAISLQAPCDEQIPTKAIPTAQLVQHWYKQLLDHAIQEYLEKIDQWYQTLEKYKRRPTTDAKAS